MKRIFVIIALFASICVLADDCYDTYELGKELYQEGKYAEAQLKFIAVSKACGNYSNVYQYIKNCNQKLVETQKHQVSQINALKIQNHQLEDEKKKADTECNNNLANAAVQVRKAENIVKLKSDTIQMQRKWNLVWRDSVMKVNRRLDSISLLLDTANLKIDSLKTILILSEKPTKKKDKKQAEKQDPIIPSVLDTLVIDSLTNDTTIINNNEQLSLVSH